MRSQSCLLLCLPLLLTLLLLFNLVTSQPILLNESSSSVGHGGAMVKRSMFPDDFIFGIGSSAYQIEGGYLDDGKGLTMWDVFSHLPGTTLNGDNGDVADDHYHRYMEDIETLASIGVDAYRFSISWPRILPKGQFGEVNQKGVMFYNKLIDNLLLKGIKPFVTLQHFDSPQEMQERYGSWLSPSIQYDFALYAKTCFENFGDKVKHWITMNEPGVVGEMSYVRGQFPPGRCSPPFGNCSAGNSDVESLIAVHNMLLSHARAVQIYREQFQPTQHGHIGLSVPVQSYVPYRDDDFSRDAASRAFLTIVAWVLDPVIYGDYPARLRKFHGTKLPRFSKEEVEMVKGSVDFIGLNHYTALYAIDCFHYPSQCTPQNNRAIRGFVQTTGYRDGIPIGDETGHADFFAVPQGLEHAVDYISTRYPNTTIYVTENGYSPPSSNEVDALRDYTRVDYYKSCLSALAAAMRKGGNVKGYFPWSFMDHFEWIFGYKPTYGFYHVNRRTLERTPKLSAKWYAHFLANKEHPEVAGISSL